MRNSSRSNVDPFIVMDVMEAARQLEEEGRHIVHMEVGQPSTGAPVGAVRAVREALGSDDPMGYTVALGLPELREKIADLYGKWYDIDLNPERVVVTNGSTGGFILAFNALFDSGDRVGIGAPGYPSYRQILTALGMEPVDLVTRPENRFQPVVEDFAGKDLAGLMVASPGNPTGTMLDKPALAKLIHGAQGEGISFISDEIYHGLEYEKKAVCALEVSDDVYVINSFSKYFSMTGWRIGWMVVPEDQVRVVERLAQNLFICPPHVSQLAALASMSCDDELQGNVDIYTANRKLLMEGLPGAGFPKIAPPDGAFYVYADVADLTTDSRALASEILHEAGVAVTPGLDFDPVRGATTLRFSYAGATEDMEEGLRRLKGFIDGRSYARRA
ncbi:MAG: 1-aminocyclopropane-1-carboxylate deaminase [Rhodobacteraceae bacterium]|nr:1-aminocyclopropane-1-carboxylate deaminase [Paracoccaceae bacterium]